MEPKVVQKLVRNRSQKWSRNGPRNDFNPGPFWGPFRAAHQSRFFNMFGQIKTSLETFVFFMLSCVLFLCLLWFLFSTTNVFQKWVPFLVLFRIRFWRQNGLRNGPKIDPKLVSKLFQSLSCFFSYFLRSWSSSGASWEPSGAF